MDGQDALAWRVGDIWEMQQAAWDGGWDVEYAQLSAGRFDGRVRHGMLGDVFVEQEHWDRSVQVRGVTPDDTVSAMISFPVGAPYTLLGSEQYTDELAIVGPGSDVDLVSRPGHHAVYLRVGVDRLAAALRALGGADVPSGTCILRLSRHDTATLHALALRALGPAGPLEQREIEGELVRLFVRSLQEPEKHLPQCPPAAVRRACDYIHAHLNRAVRIEDLCGAAGVSERTLRRGFLARFGLAPMQYVRAMRLRRARERIAAGQSVTVAALHAGFGHMGRFSGYYKQMFGELPSLTETG